MYILNLFFILSLFLAPLSCQEAPKKAATPLTRQQEWEAKISAHDNDEVDRSVKVVPDAVGFGAYSQGGYGGTVYNVTRLEDDGKEGSLRWACLQKGKRIIHFKVSGTIMLQSPLVIKESFITIDGSTAPAGGITIAGYGVCFTSCNDIIVQHIRCRLTDAASLGKPPYKGKKQKNYMDSLSVSDCYYVLIKNVSASFSIDEALSVTRSFRVTVMECFIYWPLGARGLEPGRPNARHAYGSLFAKSHITVFRCVYAFCRMRSPQVAQSDSDIVNNLVYQWQDSGAKVSIAVGKAPKHQIVNNMYILGPAKGAEREINIDTSDGKEGQMKLYCKGNVGPNCTDPQGDQKSMIRNLVNPQWLVDTPVHNSDALAQAIPALDLEKTLLPICGAYLSRDPLDELAISYIKDRTGSFIDSQDELVAIIKNECALPDLSKITTKIEVASLPINASMQEKAASVPVPAALEVTIPEETAPAAAYTAQEAGALIEDASSPTITVQEQAAVVETVSAPAAPPQNGAPAVEMVPPSAPVVQSVAKAVQVASTPLLAPEVTISEETDKKATTTSRSTAPQSEPKIVVEAEAKPAPAVAVPSSANFISPKGQKVTTLYVRIKDVIKQMRRLAKILENEFVRILPLEKK